MTQPPTFTVGGFLLPVNANGIRHFYFKSGFAWIRKQNTPAKFIGRTPLIYQGRIGIEARLQVSNLLVLQGAGAINKQVNNDPLRSFHHAAA